MRAMIRAAAALLVTITAATAAWAQTQEGKIREAILAIYPTAKITSIKPTHVPGLFEVVVGQDIVYADSEGKGLLFGQLIDTATRSNVTEARKEKLQQIDFKSLPLDLAIKTVKGNGSRVFATFEDPNCGYCRQFHAGLAGMTDYTLYTFLMPILSQDSRAKAQAIWCAQDRAAALEGWMLKSALPQSQTCDAPLQKVIELGTRLGVRGTPTLFFVDGSRTPGMVGVPQLEVMLRDKGLKTSP